MDLSDKRFKWFFPLSPINLQFRQMLRVIFYKINEYSDRDYTVMTDSEADKAWDEALDNYIDECILPDVPENSKMYFDDERWKDDARIEGRGHSLNHYDGSEEEANINDVDYYIYRRN